MGDLGSVVKVPMYGIHIASIEVGIRGLEFLLV